MRTPTYAGTLAVALALLTCTAVTGQWWVEEQQEISVSSTVEVSQKTNQYRAVTNWEDGYIEVTGYATADMDEVVNLTQAYGQAERAARVLAYERLAEVVEGIHVVADAVVEMELLKHSEVRTHLEAFIQGARVVDVKHELQQDGSPRVAVTIGRLIALPHRGIDQPPPAMTADEQPRTVTQALRPLVLEAEKENSLPAYEPPDDVPAPVPTADQQAAVQATEFDADIEYTGLIVDARGLGGKPSMAPKVLTPDGKEVWGTMQCSPAYAISYGIAGWVHNMPDADRSKRSGSTPLIVTAIEVRTAGKSQFVVSERDAAIIRQADEKTGFLDKCNVLFIT